jgi:uncharacterized protein (TIGR02145 family)
LTILYIHEIGLTLIQSCQKNGVHYISIMRKSILIYFDMKSLFRISGVILVVLSIFLIHSCKKDKPGTTVTDINGNVYNTVTIGTQTWMAENLKTTKYNDGTAIPNVTDGTAWAALTTPSYCWYNNDATTYKATYGALYNWYTVNSTSNGGKNVCPTSWHVPSDDEWTTLTTYLGGESIAGGKLKETGNTHWIASNTESTNETGFTALPGGYRYYGGTYNDFGIYGYWWSSTEYSTSDAWYRSMNYFNANVYRNFSNKLLGYSVRCVRDQ